MVLRELLPFNSDMRSSPHATRTLHPLTGLYIFVAQKVGAAIDDEIWRAANRHLHPSLNEGDPTVSDNPTPSPANSSHYRVPDQLEDLQIEIDQLALPTLSTQTSSVTQIRYDLETTSLNWHEKAYNLDVVDGVRDEVRNVLLPKAVNMLAVYRRMLGLCNQLWNEELAKKGKANEEKVFLGDVDQAIGALESLGLGDL
jgi:hypothetical protein